MQTTVPQKGPGHCGYSKGTLPSSRYSLGLRPAAFGPKEGMWDVLLSTGC